MVDRCVVAVMNRDEYREVYLRSDHWQQVRQGALERAGHRCQVCNGERQLDVHHRTYERIGFEQPGDVTVLCRGCHDLFHDSRKVQKTPKPTRKKQQQPKASRKKKGPSKTPSPKTARLNVASDRLHQIQVKNRERQEAARLVREEKRRGEELGRARHRELAEFKAAAKEAA